MKTDFFVIKGLEKPILSMKVLKDLRLIPREFPFIQMGSVLVSAVSSKIETGVGPEFDALVNEFPRVFDGKCKIMKGEPYRIDLEAGAVPVNTGASRSVREPYMPSLRKELISLIAQHHRAGGRCHPMASPNHGCSEKRLVRYPHVR